MWEERSNKLQDELKLKAVQRGQSAPAHSSPWAIHRSRGPPACSGLPSGPERSRKGRALAAWISNTASGVALLFKFVGALTIQAELATMWKRSAEKAGAGDFAEAGAAALTWKVEAEKVSRGLP